MEFLISCTMLGKYTNIQAGLNVDRLYGLNVDIMSLAVDNLPTRWLSLLTNPTSSSSPPMPD